MITVISHDLLAKGDVAAILESTGSEYVHVSSKPKKVSVINLGMTLVGVGIGKELLMAATNTSEAWQLTGETWSLPVSSAYAVDTYDQLSAIGVL